MLEGAMKLLLVFVSLLFSAGGATLAAAASPPRSAEGAFAVRAFVTDGKCAASRLTQCVLGRMRKGQELYLLDPRQSAVCRSRTLDTFMAGSLASDDFALTLIDTSACPGMGFGVAVVAPARSDYGLIAAPELAPRDVAAKIEAAIRSGYPGIAPASTEHPSQLAARPPEVFRLPAQAPGTYIAVYNNAKIPGDHTHVLYSNGRLKLIHPAANIRSIFTLDKRTYIHYAFDCKIGCGWRGDIIIEFTGDDFQTLLFDDAGSA
jgi:hypothetical protein